MKRDSVSVYLHMRHDSPSPYMQIYTFWMTPPIPQPVAYALNQRPLSQPKNIQIHLNIVFTEI